MSFDDAETEIVLVALRHLNAYAAHRATSPDYDAAGMCCKHVAGKCKELIARIEQFQKDEKDG